MSSPKPKQNPMEQTISEYVFALCSDGVLSELADESDYWKSAETFLMDNGDVPMKNLTQKQRAWVIKIKTELLEKQGE